jgi:hypothetical protein
MRVASPIRLTPEQQEALEQCARARSLSVRLVECARIVLLCGCGKAGKTTQEKPAHRTHWSTRSMAAAVGLSEATVRRIWHKNGLKPHLVETLKCPPIRTSPKS